jgi:hypothetical protein
MDLSAVVYSLLARNLSFMSFQSEALVRRAGEADRKDVSQA